ASDHHRRANAGLVPPGSSASDAGNGRQQCPSAERERPEAAPGDEEHGSEEDEITEEFLVLRPADPLGDGARHVEGHARGGHRNEDRRDVQQRGKDQSEPAEDLDDPHELHVAWREVQRPAQLGSVLLIGSDKFDDAACDEPDGEDGRDDPECDVHGQPFRLRCVQRVRRVVVAVRVRATAGKSIGRRARA
ncbi:hypothetical protein ABE10_00295, partial [Bacillus toyonensis]|nr:hypothetical protein [Bacillus toyonensis]